MPEGNRGQKELVVSVIIHEIMECWSVFSVVDGINVSTIILEILQESKETRLSGRKQLGARRIGSSNREEEGNSCSSIAKEGSSLEAGGVATGEDRCGVAAI